MIRKTELTAAQDTGLCPMFPCCRQSDLADRLFSLLVGRRHHHLQLLWFWNELGINRSYRPSPPLRWIGPAAYAACSGWMISISPFGRTRMMVTSPLCTISNSLSFWLYLASRCCPALRMSMVLVLLIRIPPVTFFLKLFCFYKQDTSTEI